jgi:1-aminocyclopropane-1-carboxylate deaminase/D-cysteine desulfhydrase-like pyridoxal-dependent ACC family enzyme
MARPCSTCQHVKRAEIDRRLAAGEPSKQIARDYGLNPSSLHRHRVNCIGLTSSTYVMKEAARSTAALACLPSKEELANAYSNLRARIDQIVDQAQTAGSLAVALQGLNALRQSLDSVARIAGHDRPVTSQVTLDLSVNVDTAVQVILAKIGLNPSNHVIKKLEKIVDAG